MVKVQKPLPKKLTKPSKNDKIIKKKNLENVKKSVNAVAAKAPLSKKKDKLNLIVKTVKKAKLNVLLEPEKIKTKKTNSEQVNGSKDDGPKKASVKKAKQPKDDTVKKADAKMAKEPKDDTVKKADAKMAKEPKDDTVKKADAKMAKEPNANAATIKNNTKQANKPKKDVDSNKVDAKQANKTKDKGSKNSVENQTQKTLKNSAKRKIARRAFKRQQIYAKRNNKKVTTIKKPSYTFESVEYDEDKFNAIVSVENVEGIVKALKEQVQKDLAQKKFSIFSDYRYLLNVCGFKIPSCPKRMVKLNVKHPLVNKDDDVVIIVPDLQRGSKIDYEPTIQHYEDLFRELGVEGLKIMPFNQLKKEYKSYEAVRKFGNTYDYFLCDGRIVGHVTGFCGKVFQKPRTTFHTVRLEKANLKAEINRALHRTAYKQLHKGDLISIPVGNHKNTEQEVAENVDCVIKQLKICYPGGIPNVRGMYLKIDLNGTPSLPIYISMGQAPAADPYVVGQREERMLKQRSDANKVLTKFSLTKDAELKKLTKTEVERKLRIREARKEVAKSEADDGEDSVVPAKKSRKEESAAVEKDVSKKSVEKDAEENKQQEDDEDNDEDDIVENEDNAEDDADDDADSEDAEDNIVDEEDEDVDDDDDDEDDEEEDDEKDDENDDDDDDDDDDDEDDE